MLVCECGDECVVGMVGLLVDLLFDCVMCNVWWYCWCFWGGYWLGCYCEKVLCVGFYEIVFYCCE